MLYLFVILFLAALVCWQYERIVLSRIFTVIKIKKLCREKNIKFKVINKLYPFSKNNKNKFDFILKIGNTVLPVKFFSAVSKDDTIIFDKKDKICIVKRYRKPFERDEKKRTKFVKTVKDMPKMRLSKKAVGERDTCLAIFLNVPENKRVLLINENGRVSNFFDGENRVAGCNFLDLKMLIDFINAHK